jgi:hypothetical protein
MVRLVEAIVVALRAKEPPALSVKLVGTWHGDRRRPDVG